MTSSSAAPSVCSSKFSTFSMTGSSIENSVQLVHASTGSFLITTILVGPRRKGRSEIVGSKRSPQTWHFMIISSVFSSLTTILVHLVGTWSRCGRSHLLHPFMPHPQNLKTARRLPNSRHRLAAVDPIIFERFGPAFGCLVPLLIPTRVASRYVPFCTLRFLYWHFLCCCRLRRLAD